jgi:aminoglycoside 6-adenylyltransferase
MWGKYFKKYLPPELYDMYVKTYSGGDYAHLWESVFTACDLFHKIALSVAGHLGFMYKQADEDGMRRYLDMVKNGTLGE